MKNSREKRCSAIGPTNAAGLLGVLKPPGGGRIVAKKACLDMGPIFLFGPQLTDQRALQAQPE